MLPDYVLLPLVLQWFIWPIVRPIFYVFGKFEIRGLENLKDVPTGAIFASNHTGELDAIFIPASLSFFSRFRPFFYTSREQEFYANTGWRQKFYGGNMFKALGAYPLLPGKHDYEKSLSTHVNLSKRGRSVIVFPEGRVGKNGILGEGRGGVAYMSYASQKPILPIAISGSYNLTLREFFGRKRRFIISYGKPLYPNDLFPNGKPVINDERNDFKTASGMVMESIKKMLEGVF